MLSERLHTLHVLFALNFASCTMMFAHSFSLTVYMWSFFTITPGYDICDGRGFLDFSARFPEQQLDSHFKTSKYLDVVQISSRLQHARVSVLGDPATSWFMSVFCQISVVSVIFVKS